MRNVLWICAAVASALTMAEARAEGEGLSADADRVPWARFQSRISYAPGAPGWRADLAPSERTGLQVGGLGLLGDVYFGSAPAPRAASPGGFRATSGLLISSRSAWLGTGSAPTSGVLATDRRLFGASASPFTYPTDPTVDNTTLPYIGIGYSNLSTKSGWHFSADLGVVSQSPGNMVRFGKVLAARNSSNSGIRCRKAAGTCANTAT